MEGRSNELDIYCIVSSGCHSPETGNWSQQPLRVEHTARRKRLFREFRESEYPLFSLICISLPLSFNPPYRAHAHLALRDKHGDIDSLTPFPTLFCHNSTTKSGTSHFLEGRWPANGPQVVRNSASRCRSPRSEQLKRPSSDLASVCPY